MHFYIPGEHTIMAQRSTVFEVAQREGETRTWITFQAEAFFTRREFNPATRWFEKAGLVEPSKRTVQQLDMTLGTVLPATPDGLPLYAVRPPAP